MSEKFAVTPPHVVALERWQRWYGHRADRLGASVRRDRSTAAG
jgi:hypothetical protein